MEIKRVLITGIANSGKTTLYNGLTGKSERVGNWYGVTTICAEARFKAGNRLFTAVDLPGAYLDGSYTLEGKNALSELKNGADLVILLCEAANLKKGLALYRKIRSLTDRIIFVVNMYGELKKSGGSIDFRLLSEMTGVKIICAECNLRDGIKKVSDAVASFADNDRAKLNISEKTADKCLSLCFKAGVNYKSFADAVFLGEYTFLPSFFALMTIVLYAAFGSYGIGTPLSYLFDRIFNFAVIKPVSALLIDIGANQFITRLVAEGILEGALGVLKFLPQLAVLNIFLSLLEESGVIARLAFMLDGVFSLAGLSGRTVFTLLTGYGCTALAVLTSNGLENKAVKKRVIFSLPFVSCSAKTPVYIYVLSLIGASLGFVFVFAVFTVGFIFALIMSAINLKLSGEKPEGLVLEMPPYRVPKAQSIIKSLQNFTKQFIIKIGGVVLTVTVLLWLLKSLSPEMVLLSKSQIERSLLAYAGRAFSFLFRPIGIDDWQFSVAVICGLFAKEGVVSSLIVCGAGQIAIRQGTAFLVFCAVYPPCIMTLAAVRRELGILSALHIFFAQLCLAIILCYIVYYYRIAVALSIVVIVLSAARLIYLKRRRRAGKEPIKIGGASGKKHKICISGVSCGGCLNEKICGGKKDVSHGIRA